MTITIEVNDEEFQREVVDLLVRRVTAQLEKELYPGDHYAALRHIYSNDVKEAIRYLLKEHIDDLSQKAIAAAATTIANKGIKQYADKLLEG